MHQTLGIRTAVVSYDDFYLKYEDQVKVTQKYSDNKLLAGRGVAGTHDMELGKTVLQQMIYGSKDGSTV